MKEITYPVEQEIEALLYAREEVLKGKPYICSHLNEMLVFTRELAKFPDAVVPIHEEVLEFLDGANTVGIWLSEYACTSRVIQNKFRIAIIDVMLARRGVRLNQPGA